MWICLLDILQKRSGGLAVGQATPSKHKWWGVWYYVHNTRVSKPKNECSHSKMEAVSFKGSLNPKQHFPQSISIVQNPNPPWPGGQLSLRISASILAFSAYLPPAINIHH